MKKLLLLVGLVVFLTPSLVSAESLEEQLAEYAKKYCQNNVENKIAILHPEGYFDCTTQQAKDKLLNQNNTTSLTNVADSDLLNSHCVVNQDKSRYEYDYALGEWQISEKPSLYVRCFCENKDGVVSNVNGVFSSGSGHYINEDRCRNSKEITYGKYLELKGYLPPGQYIEFSKEQLLTVVKPRMPFKDILSLGCRFDLTHGCREKIPKKEATFNELALSLGCGSKSKDVDDCVRRWLPSIAGTGQMTLEQINEIKKDKEMMGEIVLGISLMKRAQDESFEPSEEEQRQARAEEGYYAEQSDGEWMWVDTRSGYEKFTDRFCINCTSAQVYMINRATKRYFQGAPLSGFDKFILRGTNTSKVIKFYK